MAANKQLLQSCICYPVNRKSTNLQATVPITEKNGHLFGITYRWTPHSQVPILFGTCQALLTCNSLAILYLKNELLQISKGFGLHLHWHHNLSMEMYHGTYL
jgi:hypothetical protein